MLDPMVCQKARLARDPRFDGQFFTAVKTTKIYCRSICPAATPKEENVCYFPTAIAAATAGYRPCLRCRPDSAPHSPAWKGVDTTLERAIDLIQQGALQDNTLPHLAERLGISDRYLRQLFQKNLGLSPKAYALYQQCLFAKQLLHQTQLPITQVALASGFSSVRRFNDYFKQQLSLTPSQIRKSKQSPSKAIYLQLSYRPPYNWQKLYDFLQSRAIAGLEWCENNTYSRTFSSIYTEKKYSGYFTIQPSSNAHQLSLTVVIDDIKYLKSVTQNIRRLFDVDLNINQVEKSISPYIPAKNMISGLRLPGTWSLFEAGVRAILGQQISVTAARNLVTTLVHRLGEKNNGHYYFPTPQAIANDSLDYLKMPTSRRHTLRTFAHHCLIQKQCEDPQSWLSIKGIGPWTVDYARMRGLSDPDIYLGGDLGVKKAQACFEQQQKSGRKKNALPEMAAPWRSYLTIQLWNQL